MFSDQPINTFLSRRTTEHISHDSPAQQTSRIRVNLSRNFPFGYMNVIEYFIIHIIRQVNMPPIEYDYICFAIKPNHIYR